MLPAPMAERAPSPYSLDRGGGSSESHCLRKTLILTLTDSDPRLGLPWMPRAHPLAASRRRAARGSGSSLSPRFPAAAGRLQVQKWMTRMTDPIYWGLPNARAAPGAHGQALYMPRSAESTKISVWSSQCPKVVWRVVWACRNKMA